MNIINLIKEYLQIPYIIFLLICFICSIISKLISLQLDLYVHLTEIMNINNLISLRMYNINGIFEICILFITILYCVLYTSNQINLINTIYIFSFIGLYISYLIISKFTILKDFEINFINLNEDNIVYILILCSFIILTSISIYIAYNNNFLKNIIYRFIFISFIIGMLLLEHFISPISDKQINILNSFDYFIENNTKIISTFHLHHLQIGIIIFFLTFNYKPTLFIILNALSVVFMLDGFITYSYAQINDIKSINIKKQFYKL